MPENKKQSTSKDTPGLSSLLAVNTNKPDVSKVGSETKVVKTDKEAKTAKPKATPSSAPVVPKTEIAAKPVIKNVTETKATPKTTTKSSFSVGGNNYNIIDDNTSARKLIKWDEQGNVSPDSPVIVVGKNINGGFILAANESAKGVNNSLYPYTKDTGIDFPSLESDAAGASPLMSSIHRNTYSDLNEVLNQKAASKLRGIYKRTGQL